MASTNERSIPTPGKHGIRWLYRVLLISLLAVGLLAVAGASYEYISSHKVGQNHPPIGHLVDVGEKQIHIYCVGQGSPAVVFVSGLGEAYESWSKVQGEVGKTSRSCSYDRPGLGWSDRRPGPRDVATMVAELHDLLRASEVEPPYVLVGHSLGGGVVRVFAGRYPQEVSGLVMVDAIHPEFLKRMALDAWDENMSRTAKRMQWLAPVGLARLRGMCVIDDRPLIHCADLWRTLVAEREALPSSARQVGEVSSVGNIPLVVLSRDPDPAVGWGSPENRTAWDHMQSELPSISTRGRRTTVKGATHYIQEDHPEVVTQTILGMLADARR
jgi:pimeloyl-ACP methyl ester carboxylesterase